MRSINEQWWIIYVKEKMQLNTQSVTVDILTSDEGRVKKIPRVKRWPFHGPKCC